MNITKLIQALIDAFPILERVLQKIIGMYRSEKKKQVSIQYKKAEEKAANSDNTEDLQEIIGRKLK